MAAAIKSTNVRLESRPEMFIETTDGNDCWRAYLAQRGGWAWMNGHVNRFLPAEHMADLIDHGIMDALEERELGDEFP